MTDILAQEDFFKRKADLNTRRTAIEGRVASAVADMRLGQAKRISSAESELSLLSEWTEFTAEEQAGALEDIQTLSIEATPDIVGLKRLVSRQFDIEATIAEAKENFLKEGKSRRQPPTYPSAPSDPSTGMREKGRRALSSSSH